MAFIVTRSGKGSAITVPEMDQNFKNLDSEVLKTDNRPNQLPIFRNDIVNSGVLDPRVTFSRSSIGTYFDKFGVMKTALAGEPRIDHDPVTGECKGLLVESAATNLSKYSEQFDNAVWIKTGLMPFGAGSITNTTTTIDPIGGNAADFIQENTSSGAHDVIYGSVAIVSMGVPVTASIHVKLAGRSRVTFGAYGQGPTAFRGFDLSSGTSFVMGGSVVDPAAYSITSIGNGWYKLSITYLPTSSGSIAIQVLLISSGTTYSYVGDGASGIYIWGAQLEQGSTATSYIPTTSAAVTRQADVVKIPSTFTSSRLTNSATLQVEAKSTKLATNQTYSTIKSDSSTITQKLVKQNQSKNLLTNSENFSISPWTVSAATITATTTPNPLTETQTVWKLVDTITSSIHSVYYNITSGLIVNTPYTYSVYAKASGRDFFAIRWNSDTTRDAVFNLTTGIIVSADSAVQATIRNIGNGWYRCAITVRPTSVSSRIDFFTSANSTLSSYAGDTISGTLLFGAQLEADEKATKYVPEPAYSIQTNNISPKQIYGDIKDISKSDRFAISTTGNSVSYASNGKFIGSESLTINQISDIVIGSDSNDLNQINGHIQKIALYNSSTSTEQLIGLSE